MMSSKTQFSKSTPIQTQTLHVSAVEGVIQCPADYQWVGIITSNNTGICKLIDTQILWKRNDYSSAYIDGHVSEFSVGGNGTNQFKPADYGFCYCPYLDYNYQNGTWTGQQADQDMAVIVTKGFTSCYRLGEGGNYTYSICKYGLRSSDQMLHFVHHNALNGPAFEDMALDPKTGNLYLQRGHYYLGFGVNAQLVK